MRILHLSMLYPPHIIGGAEKSVALLAEAQVSAGYTVAACCTTPGPFVIEERGGVTVYRIPHGTSFWAEEWPQHSKLARGLRRAQMPYNYALQRDFESVIEEFKPDVIHTHSLTDVSTRVWLAANKMDVPIVHTLRDYDLLCSNSSMFSNGKRCQSRCPKCKAFTYFKKSHHQYVNAVVGVGDEILNTHIHYGYFDHIPPHLRRVIWNPAVVDGVDSSYIRPKLNGPLTFGYLGRISVDKGVANLLEACRLLPIQGWKLLLAGRAVTEDDPIFQKADGLPAEFLGFVSAKEFLEKIDVLIVPSIWAEPLPRTVLEAYALGIPVIGADSGGIPDLIGHENSEWIYPSTDIHALSDRMKHAMEIGRDNLPGRDDFAEVLKNTTPEVVVHKYGEIYQQITL